MQMDQQIQQQDSLPSNQEQQEDALRIPIQSSLQQTLNFCFISYLLYGLMILILFTLLLSIIAIEVNIEQDQVFYVCIVLIILLTVLFGCTMYIKLQFSGAKINNMKMKNEVQMNKWVYQSTHDFLFQYTSQSKFTIIRLIQLYCVVAIFYLAYNILFKTKNICQEEFEFWCGYDYYNHYDNTKNLEESEQYYGCKESLIVQGPMLIPLGILCLLVSLIFIVYEILSISQKIYLKYTLGSWPSYQHDTINIDIPQVKFQTKVILAILFINHLGKCLGFIVYFYFFYQLGDSRIFISFWYSFYHNSLMVLIFNIFSELQQCPTQDNQIQYVDYQIFIDSILRITNPLNKIFKLMLTILLIMSIFFISLYQNQIDISNVIINQDIIIYYELGITQLIYLGVMFMKYLIIPFFFDRQSGNLTQIFQEVQIQNVEHQNIQQQQPEQIINEISINNIPQYKSLLPHLFVNQNFIFNVELKEIKECAICLQQFKQNDQENPIIQLKCHISHIFHQNCIECWLIISKSCPICKIQFSQ